LRGDGIAKKDFLCVPGKIEECYAIYLRGGDSNDVWRTEKEAVTISKEKAGIESE